MFLILFGFVKDNERILVVMKLDTGAMETVESMMTSLFQGKAVLRVQNVEADRVEMIYEISEVLLKKAEKVNGNCVKQISGTEGIHSVSLVRQDDEINQ